MSKIDIDKFVASLMKHYCQVHNIDRSVCKCWLDDVLEDQGLEYKDGEIVKTQRRIAAEAKEAIFDSEDARIRKEIIRILKGELGYTSKEDADKYISWLEKHTYTQIDVDDAYLKGVTDTKNVLEKQSEQILANSAKTCKNEQNDRTNFFQNVSLTEFEEALADVCRGWIGEEIGWKDYIVMNANALLKICQKMWNEVQDAPFEQKPTWNEEDEEELGIAIQYLQRAGQWDSATWLKSLKTRLKGE